jgi:CheY-like chemotaxis protein/signal transduction histidine kinase
MSLSSVGTDIGDYNAGDMKHMVANAAHDLKTPLSSFMAGITLVAELIKELDQKIVDHVNNSYVASLLQSTVSEIKSNLKDLLNINSFMLMTINRLQDYTKASSGMKLVPKNETCELEDTLRLPLLCMQNTVAADKKNSIHMEPIPAEICEAIITDKQWLQENLLCLLSNAVKYSHGKGVTVNVKLIPSSTTTNNNNSNSNRPAALETTDLISPSNDNNRVGLMSRTMTETPSTTDRTFSFDHVSSASADSKATHLPSIHYQRPLLIKGRSSQQAAYFAKQEKVEEESVTNTSPPSLSPMTNSAAQSKQKKMLLCFEVIDSGIGVPESHKRQLFRPFQQTLQGEYGVGDREDGAAGSVFFFAVPYRPDEIAAEVLHTAREVAEEAAAAKAELAAHNTAELYPRKKSLTGATIAALISHTPSFHSSSAPSPRRKPSTTSTLTGRGIATIDNLAPLVIQRNESYTEVSRVLLVGLDDGSKGSKPLHKKASFILTKAFPSTEGTTDMIVKIIGPGISNATVIRTPRNVTYTSPKVRNSPTVAQSNTIPEESCNLSNPSEQKSGKDDSKVEVSQSANDKPKLKLLLVEDSTTIAKMTSALLKRQGHSVSVAGNGVMAVETIQSDDSFDIILMDLQMPVMDGIEATRRIRSLETTGMIKRRQRIVGLSANSDIDTVSEAFEAGFDAFMEKPIEMDVFQSTAAELMSWA